MLTNTQTISLLPKLYRARDPGPCLLALYCKSLYAEPELVTKEGKTLN